MTCIRIEFRRQSPRVTPHTSLHRLARVQVGQDFPLSRNPTRTQLRKLNIIKYMQNLLQVEGWQNHSRWPSQHARAIFNTNLLQNNVSKVIALSSLKGSYSYI